jgi:hypothetical protein
MARRAGSTTESRNPLYGVHPGVIPEFGLRLDFAGSPGRISRSLTK